VTPTPAQVQPLLHALEQVLRFEQPADRVLRQFFRDHPRLGQRDRAVVAETVFGIVRRLIWLRWLAAGESRPGRLLALALNRLHGLSGRALEGLLRNEDCAWLQSLPRPTCEPPPAVAADLPDWAWERLQSELGEEAALTFGRAMQHPAPLDLRINPERLRRDAILERLNNDGIEAVATRYSPLGIRLAGKPALQQHPLFADGSIEVQDEGSQLLGLLVGARRGERVADLCAGAGGKTLLLAGQMRGTGQVYAFDVAERRLAQLTPRLKRAGLSNVQPQRISDVDDARLQRLAGKFDRVLVDAPCTGFGTLRRNPDLRFRQSPEPLAELVAKQARILAAAATLVRPGGVLVYGTCSPFAEENGKQIEAFLAAHAQFSVDPAGPALAAAGVTGLDTTTDCLKLAPDTHATDGFFGARLLRATT